MEPFYQRDGITLYCGECSQVMSLFDWQIDLTVTSPPYDGLRDYNGYTFDFEAIAAQLWRVTAVGGVVVWVVADQTINGSESGTSFRQALHFMELGFRLHDTMIYQRKTKPLTHNRYEQEFEYMFVLSKPGKPVICNHITTKSKTGGAIHDRQTERHRQKNGIPSTVSGDWITHDKKIVGNVWRYKVGGKKSQHPAIFPKALARDHIISWSNPGDLVFDPMCGSGTTLKMAQQLGRRAVGIEISEEYCRIAVDRLRQPSFWSISESKATSKLVTQQETINNL